MMFEVSYELYKNDETVTGNNDGNFESEQEARTATGDFLESVYPGEDGWVLHSLEVKSAE